MRNFLPSFLSSDPAQIANVAASRRKPCEKVFIDPLIHRLDRVLHSEAFAKLPVGDLGVHDPGQIALCDEQGLAARSIKTCCMGRFSVTYAIGPFLS